MATILYGRVSTIEQTNEHQLSQAMAAGFKIDDAVFDNGTSGISTSSGRKAGGCSISCGPVMCLSFVGLTGSAATMTTFARRSASSCGAVW
jgi:hypothetical protein